MNFFVACAKGLEYLLVDELLLLGCQSAKAAVAGVRAEGEVEHALRAALWSRLGSRMLWPLKEFDCPDENALYEQVHAVDWSEHLAADGSLIVDAHVGGSELTHARYAAQRVKDAVVDRLRAEHGIRPSVDADNPDLRIDLALRKGKAVLSIDLAGSLHRRGWRLTQGEAPLRETLAAAVLLRGNWPKLAQAGAWLLDPMCGSGTLLIEGALMLADTAPGLLRHGDNLPTRWRQFDGVLWQRLIAEARQRDQRANLPAHFVGRDIDTRIVQAARRNAEAAGVDEAIDFASGAIVNLAPIAAETGLVVCNPPYDRRLSANSELYQQLGNALRAAVPNWSASLLCGSEELAFATALRANKRYTLFNGALECTLIICDPIAPPLRVPSEPKPLSEGSQMVVNRLRKNLRHLQRWCEREAVSCYRLYDADLPEYAAAIDLYQEEPAGTDQIAKDSSSPKIFLHVQEYQAPATVDEQAARRRFGELRAAIGDVFHLPSSQIALKTRARGKGGSKYGRFAEREQALIVREGQVRLEVNLFDYLDTGLFLDHRPLRLQIAEIAKGKRFLNLFGYTGAASVHAAVGGAKQTTSVDLSVTYLEWTARNLALNDIGGPAHRLVQADVMRWLAAERGDYDLIFCDPPTFSNSARAEDFDVQKAHVELLRLAIARLSPGGLLLFSNNFRRFKLDDAAIAEFAQIKEISEKTIPEDFSRNPRIHRAWELRKLA